MSFDAYAVAVKITLANHVSAGLKVVREELQTTGFEVGKLNTKLEFLAKNSKDAWAALRSGRDVANVFKAPANDAARYQRELDKLHRTLEKPFSPVAAPVFNHPAINPANGGSGGNGSGIPPVIPIPIPAQPVPARNGRQPPSVAGAYHSAMNGMMAGGMMVAGGMAIAGALKGPVREAIEYQRELAKLQQYGLGASQISEAQDFVRANEIIGTSIHDRLQMFADAQGAFRESGMSGSHALDAAKIMMPVLSKYQVASGMLGDGKSVSQDQLQQLNKTVELMGGLNSPKRAEEIADGIFRAVQSSGKMVSNRDMRQFITQGGVATAGLTDKAIFAGLEPIIGEFGGSSTGTGLQTAYSRSHGMNALMPSITTNEMLRLGVWEEDKVKRTKGGGARFEHGNPMEANLSKLQETDPVQFAKAMMEVYTKHGITSINDIGRENNILFGRTGGRVYTKIMQQIEVLERSEKAFDNAKGINQTVDNNANSPMMKILAFHKAMDDLGLAIGDVIIPVLMPVIKGLTSFAHELSKHPALVKGLTYALIGLSAFLVTGGLISMIAAAGRGFVLLGQAMIFLNGAVLAPMIPMLARFGTYFVIFVVDAFKAAAMFLSSGFLRGIVMAFLSPLKLLAQGVMFLGRALLMTPIGLVITAIAAAAFLLWNNWAEISGALKLMWSDMKTGFIKLFNGDIGGAFKSFALVFMTGWQTIFNTLIAGANAILPASMQISKTTFADDYRNSGKPKEAWSPLVAPVPAKSSDSGEQNINLYVDGKKITDVVIQRMAAAASKPRTGTQGFDPTRSMLMPGTPSTALPR